MAGAPAVFRSMGCTHQSHLPPSLSVFPAISLLPVSCRVSLKGSPTFLSRQADILADLRCGPLLSRLWLRPDVPAPAVHADVQPLLHVRGGARAHAHCGREPPGLPRPRPLGLGLQAPPLGLSRSAPPSCPQPGNSVGQTSLLSNRGPPDRSN